MHIKSRNIVVLILLLLIYFWYFLSNLTHPKNAGNIVPTTGNLSLFIQPESGRKPIIDAIDKAQKEILVEVYLISDKAIISSLESAKKRGVIVNIMVEQHPFGGGNLNNTSSQVLIKSGVSFKWTNPAFALTHEKSIVIDNSKVFILSQNLTAASFSKNREYDILDTNINDVSEIRNIFISDWERKDFISSQNSGLVVCPINCRSAIIALASSAKSTLDIEMEVIEDAKTVALLSDLAKSLKIRLIVPTISQITSNKKSLSNLKHAGVLIKTLSSPYIHAKLIVVDNKKAYVGSINFTTQSMDQNREVGIILTQPQTIASLSKTFNSDWEKGSSF